MRNFQTIDHQSLVVMSSGVKFLLGYDIGWLLKVMGWKGLIGHLKD